MTIQITQKDTPEIQKNTPEVSLISLHFQTLGPGMGPGSGTKPRVIEKNDQTQKHLRIASFHSLHSTMLKNTQRMLFFHLWAFFG